MWLLVKKTRRLAHDGSALAKYQRGRLGALPSPLWGGVGGGGRCLGQHQRFTASPPPPTPPPAGCGLARFRQILEVTKPRQAGVWLGGGSTPSVGREQTRVRQQHRQEFLHRPDEIDHGGFVGARREADGGGAGGRERLRNLAGGDK